MESTPDTPTQKQSAERPLFFHKKSASAYNHIGVLQFPNSRQLETPILWYGLSVVESVDFQLEVFRKSKVEAFLSNVYDLLVQDPKGKRMTLIQTLVKDGLFHKMDSGGFQLMKAAITKKKVPIDLNPELVFQTQKRIGCDVAVQLDVPLSPFLSPAEKKHSIDTTIANFVKLKALNEELEIPLTIMPVAHGYTNDMLDYCIDKYEEILDDIPIIGIGSLVPMVKSIKGTNEIGGKWTFVSNLIHLRKRLPNSMIHAFGIGGTMSYLAFYCGVDSLDSNGWIQKSGYGVIQLPGVSDRFLTQKAHNRPYLIEERYYENAKRTINEKDLFMQCTCPVCTPFQDKQNHLKLWDDKVATFDQDGTQGRLNRSIHNVFVFNNELQLIRNAIRDGNLDEFIENRLITSQFYKFFLYAKCLKQGNFKKAESIKLERTNGQKSLDKFLKFD